MAKAGKSASKRQNKSTQKSMKLDIAGFSPVRHLFARTLKLWWRNKRMMVLLSSLYFFALASATLLADQVNVDAIRLQIIGWAGDDLFAEVVTSFLFFTSGNQLEAIATYLRILYFIIFSLASIWMIRRMFAEKAFRFKDAFYKGMYPLIPFALTLLLVLVQMSPFLLGALIYSFVSLSGIGFELWVEVPFLMLWIVLSIGSAFLLSGSVMSLYAVTLPDMEPNQASAAVRKVIFLRRWRVVFRMMAYVLIMLVVVSALFVVSIALRPGISFYVLDGIVAVLVPFTHMYMFNLYKEVV